MAAIKERGTIYQIGEVVQGTSQSGSVWQRQQILLEVSTGNNSIRRIAVQAGTQLVADLQKFKVGDKVDFSYIVSAREWQGRWYNNVDLFSIAPMEVKTAANAPARKKEEVVPTPDPVMTQEVSDLPF